MNQANQLREELQTELDSKWTTFSESLSYQPSFLDDTKFLDSLKRVFLFSDFTLKKCQFLPEMLEDLYSSGDFEKSYSPDEYKTRLKDATTGITEDSVLGATLRRFRNRELVRIAWRDLTRSAALDEILLDISNLAKACVDRAFQLLYEWQRATLGTPVMSDGTQMKVVALGMGKLGADELNFSSDIDLIFAFPEAGSIASKSGPVSHEQFFTKLCQRFMRVFAEKGPEGFLYRVDMRLRPFGESGPIVMSFDAMEEYYELQGREWERYALIKAGAISGEPSQADALINRLKPFVFRRYLDYSVYDSLREMKRNITMEITKKGYQNNIKLGAGGIREIEFFGQIFQLVRGGVERHLQTRSILEVLSLLAEDGYIAESTRDELKEAYVFLRLTENRLQEYGDQQTHQLPENEIKQAILAATMGFDDWSAFRSVLNSHLEKVHFHFNELLLFDQEDSVTGSLEEKLESIWQGIADEGEAEETLRNLGYADPNSVKSLLEQFRNDIEAQRLSPKSRQWLDKLVPQFIQKSSASNNPTLVLRRIFDLVNQIGRRAIYISLLLENPAATSHLVKLADSSSWIMSFLSRHPILLDELLDRRTLFQPPDRVELERDLFRRLGQIEEDDLEKQLEELIIFKNVNVFHVAAADISGGFQLMKVSDYLSYTAETVLSQVLRLSWSHLEEKYGRPTAMLDGENCDTGFVIIAYGKLGGFELSYGSDLDLVFINAAIDGDTEGREMTIDNSQFYARLGQRIVHLLTANTRAGKLYEIDMRLRPNGNSGILVSKMNAFREYQLNEAWTWEHQALLRARPVCGDPRLIDQFMKIKKEVITQPRDQNTLKEEIRSMRAKMRKEKGGTKTELFDIKQGEGGLVDIEFLVQYLALANASDFDEFARWTDNVRLIGTLNKTRLLDNETANALRGAYLRYRAAAHKLNLREEKTSVSRNAFDGIQKKIQDIWDRYLG